MAEPLVLTTTGVESSALISPCGSYRYELRRTWSMAAPLLVIMCNPSTADGTTDDATIRVLTSMARFRGYGGLVVGNVFALRAKDPGALLTHHDPVGPDNVAHLERLLGEHTHRPVLCAWGDIGAGPDAEVVVELIRAAERDAFCLALTKNGNPRHPLRWAIETPWVLFGGRLG